jgi:hypothetical protein
MDSPLSFCPPANTPSFLSSCGVVVGFNRTSFKNATTRVYLIFLPVVVFLLSLFL